MSESESGHTPGPWSALVLKKYTRVRRESQGRDDQTGSVQICHIAGPEDDEIRPWNGKRWEADARLIAAAPELLEALEKVAAGVVSQETVRHARFPQDDCVMLEVKGDVLQIVRAAIAKAKGTADA